MSPLSRFRRLTRGAFGALVLFLFATGVVLAHAELTGSDPADGAVLDRSPVRVQLVFSEPVEPDFFSVEVYASDRSRVDRRDARVSPADIRVLEASLAELGTGTYTVVWRALSLDSHVIRGTFAFTVGAGATPGRPLDLGLPAEGAPFPIASAARWLTFLTSFVLIGGFAFRPLVLDVALRKARRDPSALVDGPARRWLWIAWPALGLLFVVTFAALLFQASSAAGIPLNEVLGGRAVTRVLTTTRYGGVWIARLVLLLGLVGVLAGLSASSGGGRRLWWWAGTLLSAGVLLTISASGHASGIQGPLAVPAVVVDWAHLIVGGLWIGGLVQLGLAIPAAFREAGPNGRRFLLGVLVPRFSLVAGLAVAVLILTGIFSGRLHLPNWSAFLDTPYGAALSGKLLLVALILGIAAINLLVLSPRFRRALRAAAGAPDDGSLWRIFRVLVLGEATLAVAVLAVTGILTGLPPASSLPLEGKPFSETRRVGDLSLTYAVSPNQAGDNKVDLTLMGPRGTPETEVDRVRLTLTMLDMTMGPRELEATQIGPGRFEVRGGQMSMAGRWRADVALQRGGAPEPVSFNFVVGQAPGANRPAFSPARIALFALNARAILVAVALVGGTLLLVRRGSLRRPRERRQAAGLAVVFLAIGLMSGTWTIADAYARSLPNPVPADAASLARGKETYDTICALCHGISGRGDGPSGATLRPKPADFRVHMAAGHTDQDLFNWVSNGVDGTAMPVFKDQLSEQQRWDAINYIRSFAGQP